MSWVNSFFAAILVAIFSTVAGGFVTAGYVVWYRVSPREGGSGYMVIIFALLSGCAGFVLGFILSHLFGASGAAGFFKGVGISMATVLVCAGIIALICRSLADIPPTLNGHELNLVVEVRMPAGAERPVANESQQQFIWFESGPIGGPARAREYARLDLSKSALVDGRWIVHGAVHIFTTRETRSFTLSLGEKQAYGFQLRFPVHPGPEYKEWSKWIPDAVADHYPESKISYRFRIEEIIPLPPMPANDPYYSLTYDSPLTERLKFYDPFGRDPERKQAIVDYVEAHQSDLAKVIRTDNDEDFGRAMDATQQLKTVDPVVVQAMRDVAADLATQIVKLNVMNPQQAEYATLSAHIASRFHRWTPAWEMVQFKAGFDGRLPVEKILKLAQVHSVDPSMQHVISDAQDLLVHIAANLPK